jgi:hypothetical protein
LLLQDLDSSDDHGENIADLANAALSLLFSPAHEMLSSARAQKHHYFTQTYKHTLCWLAREFMGALRSEKTPYALE